MASFLSIIKASSAIGMFCGAAYVYFSKSKLQFLQIKKTSNVLNNVSQDIKSEMLDKLSAIEILSKKICEEIMLVTPPDTLKKSISSTLLEKINSNNYNIHKNLEGTLNTLSVCTKNDDFLTKFVSQNGLIMLKDLLLFTNHGKCLTDGISMTLSEILANISQRKESIELLELEYVNYLLKSWQIESNIVLNLNVTKIFSNISELKQNQKEKTIYPPDVFLLDHQQNISEIKDYDIIFINGMLGSVYFTWRQHDNECEIDSSEKTKCWPRDWLSVALPRARVIGINALLRPFVWNPMSDIDKINRSIEDRAKQISNKLKISKVGNRPILWVTHSAGGILLKHILHLNEENNLASSTKGIMFMSTPHSGAQSMLGLYYFPFKYFLTPEAKHLETNSQVLLKLNNWFKSFVKEKKIEILTLTETEPTKINKFYSTIIVPKCDGEFDGHEQLKIKSNHLYISKPKSQSDQIYVAVLNFVMKTLVNRDNLDTVH